jgi:sulfur-carrier protein
MKINIIIFGQLCEVLGEKLVMDNIADTESLQQALHKKFPELVNYKYAIAVNKKQVTTNTVFNNDCTVALLPPFSGG